MLRQSILTSAVLALTILGSQASVAAPNNTGDSPKQTMCQVIKNLKDQGYVVDSIERDYGRYNVDATQNGQEFELVIDGNNGQIVHRERDDD